MKQRKFQEALMEFRAAGDIDKNSAEAHYGKARSHEGLGQVLETIQELQKTVELDAENLEAKNKLGNYYLLIEPPQTQEAEKLLNEILAANPNYVEGYILQASLLSRQGKSQKEILEAFNKAVSIEPNRVETYISLSRFYMKLNNAAEAEKTIQKAISVNQNSPLGYAEYGRFLSFSNRMPEAEEKFKKAIELDLENIEPREALAQFYASQKQFEKAEQTYKEIIELQKNSEESRVVLANFYALIGREKDAVQVFEAIINDNPQYVKARYRLGEIHLENKEYEKVTEQVEKLLTINDDDSQALLLRAKLNIQQNNPEKSVEDLTEILKKQPSYRPALFYMAQARLNLGQTDQARGYISDLEKYHPSYYYSKLLNIQASFSSGESEKALNQASQFLEFLKTAQPNVETTAQDLEDLRVRALTARGIAHLEIGKLAEAKADLSVVQQLSPNSPATFLNLARVSMASKNYAEALASYEKVLTIDAKSFDALNGMVNVLNRQKQFAQAHAKVDKSIAENSADKKVLPALHYLKAETFRAEKNLSEAENELNKALQLDENYLPAYSALATLMITQNQSDKAIQQYQKVIAKKPDAAIYTLIGMLEDSRQNFDESEKHYRKALELSPNSPIATNNLAWNIAATEKGNLDEAVTLMQGMMDKYPSQAGFYDTIGYVYFKKGLFAPAIENFKKAIAMDATDASKNGRTTNAGYRLRLGQAYAASGDKINGRKEIEVALRGEKNLSQKEVQEARNFLGNL
ncbi:MAG: tetratricopeptide repeat protein [Pyrinomonadaceae bacterium]|nr:tetratricopeptide repeat protein [Pyrinomonadaceae bacterium]